MPRGIRNPKMVFITGAGSGIGRATARRYAKKGATVISTDINVATAEETVALIEAEGGKAVAYHLDVTDDAAWQALAARVRDTHGVPDVLINNAGIAVIGSFLDHTKADWDRQLAVNLDGVVNGCRAFAPMMAERRRGQIVNIASVMAFLPTPMTPSYSVAKAGVRMFSESLRTELANHNVGVTVICPGGVATGIIGGADVVGDVGVDAEKKNQVLRIVDQVTLKYGPMLFPPDYIARGIVHAVNNNWAVVPVRPEAWLGYIAHRVSPGLTRFTFRWVFNPGMLRRLGEIGGSLAPDQLLELAEALAAKAPDSPAELVAGLVRRPKREDIA